MVRGRPVYLLKRVIGDRGVFRIRIHGGTEEKIADLKDFHDGLEIIWGWTRPTHRCCSATLEATIFTL
jgi:hypothetical protein